MDTNIALIPDTYPMLDDGDAHNLCTSCAFAPVCLNAGYDKGKLRDLHVLVEHVGPYEPGQHIFWEGGEFNAIWGIRSGTIKTYVTDLHGREQVKGFFLAGEIIGLNAISKSLYPCNAVALDSVLLCRFSFPKIATLATQMPGLQKRLFELLSEDIGKADLLMGDFTADERMAAFLLILSKRYATTSEYANRFRLPMTRTDIANYLRLAPETVSRILRRFRDDQLLKIDRRQVTLLDLDKIHFIASSILRS